MTPEEIEALAVATARQNLNAADLAADEMLAQMPEHLASRVSQRHQASGEDRLAQCRKLAPKVQELKVQSDEKAARSARMAAEQADVVAKRDFALALNLAPHQLPENWRDFSAIPGESHETWKARFFDGTLRQTLARQKEREAAGLGGRVL